MVNISSILGFSNGDLDSGRSAVNSSLCGDKEQDFSQHGHLSSPTTTPVDVGSFESTFHSQCGGFMGRYRKASRNIVIITRKWTL
jgi:hypothetical protein